MITLAVSIPASIDLFSAIMEAIASGESSSKIVSLKQTCFLIIQENIEKEKSNNSLFDETKRKKNHFILCKHIQQHVFNSLSLHFSLIHLFAILLQTKSILNLFGTVQSFPISD